MAVLRLFAQAREAAGVSSTSVEGESVAQVIDNAASMFGDEFSEVLKYCKIWLNGQAVDLDVTVNSSDELAVLPPVSGG